jgi:ketosteroid isomerase-like protein
MKKNVLSSLLVMLALVCSYVPAYTQSDAELKAKITKINHEMAQAMVEGNIQKNLSYYADDAISMPNNAKMVEGLAGIKKSSEEMMASGVKLKSFETTTLHTVICGDKIIEIGNFNISYSVPGMADLIKDAGKYLTVWEKQPDGSLKIKVETWNSDISPMTGATAESDGN